LTDLERPCGRH